MNHASIFTETERLRWLLGNEGPVRLYWRTAPFAVDERASPNVECRLKWDDFETAAQAIRFAAERSHLGNFCEPWLTDTNGNHLTFGGELPALIAHHMAKAAAVPEVAVR